MSLFPTGPGGGGGGSTQANVTITQPDVSRLTPVQQVLNPRPGTPVYAPGDGRQVATIRAAAAPAAASPSSPVNPPINNTPALPQVNTAFSPTLTLPGQQGSTPISSLTSLGSGGGTGATVPTDNGSNNGETATDSIQSWYKSLSGNTVALIGAGIVIVAVAFFFVLKK